MPRILKRRSDALNEDVEESASNSPQPARRRRSASASSSSVSNAEDPSPDSQSNSILSSLINKLVRLALSTEYSRTPLRRGDISSKVLTEAYSRQFKPVFAGAQNILQETFGMQLVELPSREKNTLKDRRAQATRNAARRENESQKDTQSKGANGGNSSGSKSWMLTSILPAPYKHSPLITTPSRAPTHFAESTYTALYTLIVSLIYLCNGALPENKLERYLKRVNTDEFTPLEMSLDKLLTRMVKDGYVEKRRDTSTGEEVVEWVVGPRGKVEVGEKGVVGLVKSVYGFGATSVDSGGGGDELEAIVKQDEDDINARLARSLGIKDVNRLGDEGPVDRQQDAADEPAQRRRRPATRGAVRDESDDDD